MWDYYPKGNWNQTVILETSKRKYIYQSRALIDFLVQ